MKVFAVHCHPDDIEFMMVGTLLHLRERECELHYMNLANGCYGATRTTPAETASLRRDEARAAADCLGAEFHESIANDLEVFYTEELIRKLLAVVRTVSPDVMLIPSPLDYMEDHMNVARIAVTAAFCRGVPNYESDPPVASIDGDVVLYHAQPHGLRDGLRRRVQPDFWVDVTNVIDQKTELLAFHASQQEWLDRTQGFGSYLKTMRDMAQEAGTLSGRYQYAEGWLRHSHVGFSSRERDPLGEMLADLCVLPTDGGNYT